MVLIICSSSYKKACKISEMCVGEGKMKKRLWTVEEDIRLLRYIKHCGDRRWSSLAKASGLQRCGRSCRLRWVNHLHPDLKHNNITVEEENIIIELHGQWGSRWSQIAERIPGRTDNEIKNYWRTYLKKKLQNPTQNKNIADQNYSPEAQEHAKKVILPRENLVVYMEDSIKIPLPYDNDYNHPLFVIENPMDNFSVEEMIRDVEAVQVQVDASFPGASEAEGRIQIEMAIAGNNAVELSTMAHSIHSGIPIDNNAKTLFEASSFDNAMDQYSSHDCQSDFESDIKLWNTEITHHFSPT